MQAVCVVGVESSGVPQAQGEAPSGALQLRAAAGSNQVLLSGDVKRAASSRFAFTRAPSGATLQLGKGKRRLSVHALAGEALGRRKYGVFGPARQ